METLAYALKHAGVEAKIIAQVAKSGGKLPDGIRDAPELRPDLELFWRAFWELHSCRRYEGALIPWDAVAMWASTYDLPGPDAEFMQVVIREMDLAYLAHVATQREKARSNATPGKR